MAIQIPKRRPSRLSSSAAKAMAETGVPFVTEGSSTEASSKYDGLEKLSTAELLVNMNQEDQSVPLAVAKERACSSPLTGACFVGFESH